MGVLRKSASAPSADAPTEKPDAASAPANAATTTATTTAGSPTTTPAMTTVVDGKAQDKTDIPLLAAEPRTSASASSNTQSRSSTRRGSRRRADTASAAPLSSSRSSLPSSASLLKASASVVLDRRLLAQYEQVSQEIERVARLSSSADQSADGTQLVQVRAELRRAKQSSSKMIQSQKDLLDKMERQERGGPVRRMFSVNKAAKLAKLRAKLSDKLTEAARVDEELERLERQSTMLTRTSLAAFMQNPSLSQPQLQSQSSSARMDNPANSSVAVMNSRPSSSASSRTSMSAMLSPADVQEELHQLEREKQDILNNLFQSAHLPDAIDLHARISSYSAEIQAASSVLKQVERVEGMYRKALHLLRIALATVVAPDYSGSVREFATSAYPLAVEASHLVEQAAHVVQPEARRRYSQFAPEIIHARPPKFPQAVSDFERRSRTHYDPHSALAIEGMRHLRAAENVVIVLQRLVIQKLEVIDQWRERVEKDLAASDKAHAQLDARLQEQMAVLARSVSV